MNIAKLKVVWICHFSNKDIRDRLPLSKMKLKHILKSLIGRKTNYDYTDFAPWVTNLIKEFEKFEDIELHVISPFIGITKLTYEFKMNNIFYYLYKADLPIFDIFLPYKFYLGGKPKYIRNRHFIKKFIKKINPDIVNLIGTENPYYSMSVLDIKNIPVFVSVQTVYTNPDREKHGDTCIRARWDVEIKIHKKEIYYGCSGRMHRDLILNNNPNAIIFKMFFPLERPKQFKKLPKIFDFVFFAGIAKKKGIEDLIDALVLVKKVKNDVKLNVVGRCSDSYRNFLVNKIKRLNLFDNIIFTDYFPVHYDMHQHIVQSHFAVLPVKLDIIPGSVFEAILLDLPVVTYKTTGTPYLNKNGESVLLGDIDDIETLADNMKRLLQSPSLGEELKENATTFVNTEFNNKTSALRFVSIYKAVIEHYNHNVPIPDELMFDTNEFPLY